MAAHDETILSIVKRVTVHTRITLGNSIETPKCCSTEDLIFFACSVSFSRLLGLHFFCVTQEQDDRCIMAVVKQFFAVLCVCFTCCTGAALML